ncbi:23721_t:CDS:2, partial [Gigaspora rosea]
EIPCQFTEKLPNTQPFWLILNPIKDLPGYPEPPKGTITQNQIWVQMVARSMYLGFTSQQAHPNDIELPGKVTRQTTLTT